MPGVTVLQPPEGYVSSHPVPNFAALRGWHRARGRGITLVYQKALSAANPTPAWSGYAAVDDVLSGDVGAAPPHTWTLADLRHRAGAAARAIAFPGGPRPQTALLDRDGTIIEDVHYLADPDRIRLLPGAIDGLVRLQALGLRLVIVTNQSGVGVGQISQAALAAVNRKLLELLAAEGITIAGIYICPHRRDEGCHCRKPAIGLAQQAAAELGLDLTRVIMVGDKAIDIGLARGLGAPGFLVTTGHGAAAFADGSAVPDYLVDGLQEVAAICEDPAGLATALALPPD